MSICVYATQVESYFREPEGGGKWELKLPTSRGERFVGHVLVLVQKSGLYYVLHFETVFCLCSILAASMN